LEVLEHLKDGEAAPRCTWIGNSIRVVLQAIWRTLRRGGRLLVSTPNVTGWITLMNVIAGRHPFTYAPHPRELAPSDVRTFLDEAGFRVERMWTSPVWRRHGLTTHQQRRLAVMLSSLGASADLRDDCLFAWAVKP
jgi:hypothetical protein